MSIQHHSCFSMVRAIFRHILATFLPSLYNPFSVYKRKMLSHQFVQIMNYLILDFVDLKLGALSMHESLKSLCL